VRFGVIGVGSFGRKRAQAVIESRGQLVAVADTQESRATRVAAELGVLALPPPALLADPRIDAVIVCTPNRDHAAIGLQAVEQHKHVIIEKPLARSSAEAAPLASAARKAGVFVKTGANHRFFPSVQRARQLLLEGAIGEVLHFNGRIGHDGERLAGSWSWDAAMSGGGSMLDNGCHLLDIARWIMGPFVAVTGMRSNVYWRDCGVEDTAAAVYATAAGKMAVISASWRQLSGYLHFEVNGSDGYLTVDGRFDTHGGDRLYWQSRKAGSDIFALDFGHRPQRSYVDELDAFIDAVAAGVTPEPTVEDGIEVLRMVEALYRADGTRERV